MSTARTAPFVPVDIAEPDSPQEVIEAFLARLAALDLPAVLRLTHPRIRWVNVGLPTISGRRFAAALRLLQRVGLRFEVYLHSVAASGPTVLTERTDVLILGPVRVQFWVLGRLDVHDGRITLWRDAFDNLDIARAVLRGLLGAVLPVLRPRAPSSPDSPPGR